MATSSPSCGVCDLRHNTKPSIVWCTECDEGLCTECQEHHSLSKASRYHNVIPINEYQKLPIDVLKLLSTVAYTTKSFRYIAKNMNVPAAASVLKSTENSPSSTEQSVDFERKEKRNRTRNKEDQNEDQQPSRQTAKRFDETTLWAGRKRKHENLSVIVIIRKKPKRNSRMPDKNLEYKDTCNEPSNASFNEANRERRL
ncbi:unnamed protein product [Mytilus edulis]|uniref:B box-type domain-containing protein n=1 Tax=Mytilus edulis TaxID=6550 RepID=A0A8S3QI52_MYTED|nr:unnamed protein product [Mytilus edulis]